MEKIIREQTRVFLNKNKDYGDSYQDQLEEHGIVAFKVVAGFKISRMMQFVESEELENESAKDSALDLLNYAVMTGMWGKKGNTLKRFVYEMYTILENKKSFEKYYLEGLKDQLKLTEEEVEGVRKIYYSFLNFKEEDI